MSDLGSTWRSRFPRRTDFPAVGSSVFGLALLLPPWPCSWVASAPCRVPEQTPSGGGDHEPMVFRPERASDDSSGCGARRTGASRFSRLPWGGLLRPPRTVSFRTRASKRTRRLPLIRTGESLMVMLGIAGASDWPYVSSSVLVGSLVDLLPSRDCASRVRRAPRRHLSVGQTPGAPSAPRPHRPSWQQEPSETQLTTGPTACRTCPCCP